MQAFFIAEHSASRWQRMRHRLIPTLLVILLGPLLVYFVAHTLMVRQTEVAITQIGANMQRSVERHQQHQLELAREATRQKQIEMAAKEREQVLNQARLAADQRKERAWQAFYAKPKKCEAPVTNEILIECGNDFIRAKREFDAQWLARDSTAQDGAQINRKTLRHEARVAVPLQTLSPYVSMN